MSQMLEINTPLGEGVVLLTQLTGHEQLGQMPEYGLSFLSSRADISADDLLTRDITIGINLPQPGDLRYFNGFITSLTDAGSVTGDYFGKGVKAYRYHATMHPWLWFLTRRANCRIFQNKSVPDIIEAIFGEYPFAEFKRNFTGTYAASEYCCQYRETDFNFVCRLMEQEGIYFYFSHEDGKHVMQLCDAPSVHHSKPGYADVIYDDSTGGAREEDRLNSWHCSLKAQSGSFEATSYNFKTPTADLTVRANDPGSYPLNKFEVFDFGEEYTTKAQGDKLATIRAEELSSRHEIFEGSGNVRGLAAGQTFKLKEHTRGDFNKEYLIIASSFSASNGDQGMSGGKGGTAEYHGSLKAVSSRVRYRPARSTPKPTIPGPQSAVVVGQGSDEIYTDEFGRAKVQFFWDRYSEADENSSCWLRVSQPLAGKEWGALFLPRVGQEVIVEFLEGDPNQPLITGRLYNAGAKPPWELPTNKTRSGIKTRTPDGSGFNELRFEDKSGEEDFYIHAQKDKTTYIEHDELKFVGNESHRYVTKDVLEQFDGEHHLSIKGDQNVKSDGSFSIKTSQDWLGKVGTNYAVDAGTNVHIKAGTTVVIEAGAQLSLKVGGNFIDINPGGIFIKGTMVMINSGGSAGSGQGANPNPPKEPKRAETSKGGEGQHVTRPQKPEKYSPQATSLKLAHKNAAPFCAACDAASEPAPAASPAP